jgi:hypothetical protein
MIASILRRMAPSTVSQLIPGVIAQLLGWLVAVINPACWPPTVSASRSPINF